MDTFTTYISENMLVVVPVLYIVGAFIKKAPKVPDWIIPFVLTGLGVVIGIATSGWGEWTQGLMQGILCAGGAVLANQMYKQVGDALGIDRKEPA